MKTFLYSIALYLCHAVICLFLSAGANAQPVSTTELYKAAFTSNTPTVDGIGDDVCWQDASWVSMNNLYLGAAYSPSDFTGRYKIVWTASKLYLLAEITDDILSDDHAAALTNWWDDDCVEIFLDENKSGGDHLNNYNAFAYHVGLNYDVVDQDASPHLYNSDISTQRTTNGNVYTWEFAINVYPDTYTYGGSNTPVTLTEGKILGFNLAYCDNDAGTTRESFIGSRLLADADKDRGYINADVFASLELVASTITSTKEPQAYEVTIYPNPASGFFIITTDYTIDYISVKNNLGLEVTNFSYKNNQKNISVDLSNLPKGLYTLQIRSGEKITEEKIILQ